ncbi:UNVERIFIED_CONTAM: hypothetical protein RMT77_016851 [Armadillidium vulgare]
MDVEIHKWCDELGLKGEEATEFIKLHKFDIDVYEYIQLCKEMEMENDDIIELFLIGAEIRRRRCRVYYDRLLEVSEREAAAEKFERKCKLLENEFISKVEETPNPIIEVISTKKSSTPESVSLENIVIEIEKPITSSQESPMEGEDSFFQPETFDEKEPPLLQDVPFLPALYKWERNEDEISSISKVFAEQDEKEENLVTSDVTKRTENAVSSKELSNESLISRKVYMEKNKEKEIERRRTPISEWGKVDTQEAEKKGSSIQITISSKTESQIERPRIGKSEFESENEVHSTALDGKSVVEKDSEESKHDMNIVKHRDRSLCNEKKAVKRSWLDCEKASQLSLPQNKRNSENLHKKHVKIQRNNFSNQQEMWDGKGFYVKVDPKSDDNLQKYSMENQDINISDQQEIWNEMELDVNVDSKFDDTSQSEDAKVESDSHLFFSSLFLSSSSLSSFRGDKEGEVKRKKKKKYHKNKRKRYNDINGDERLNSNYKCGRETPNKRFIIQAEKLKQYKYRRKGKIIIK